MLYKYVATFYTTSTHEVVFTSDKRLSYEEEREEALKHWANGEATIVEETIDDYEINLCNKEDDK